MGTADWPGRFHRAGWKGLSILHDKRGLDRLTAGSWSTCPALYTKLWKVKKMRHTQAVQKHKNFDF